MSKVEDVRDELDRRHDMLGGEFPGQLNAVKMLTAAYPNEGVAQIADRVEDSLPQYFPKRTR